MAQYSKIEWTHCTWNPTTGCKKVSPGCKNCYAETMSRRLQSMGVTGYENGFELSILPERLNTPLNRKSPTIYFVNSMSDLFHEDIPDQFIRQVFDVMKQAPQHKFQILTKRAERMASFFDSYKSPPNAWLGVSVEDKEYGVPRIKVLQSIDSKIRFLSAEPLLDDLGELDLKDIHWVIVGGKSGINARSMNPDWVSNIQKQCDTQNVSFFFKQWGAWGEDGVKCSKKANGRLFRGRTWDAMPVDDPDYDFHITGQPSFNFSPQDEEINHGSYMKVGEKYVK
ncbi:phage Gp37/Gp68 family protein [Chloroflexi bacterium TSY]|nr:phage Gp37/Gp68 family protein [Chloroflexi bacterium TSY]